MSQPKVEPVTGWAVVLNHKLMDPMATRLTIFESESAATHWANGHDVIPVTITPARKRRKAK